MNKLLICLAVAPILLAPLVSYAVKYNYKTIKRKASFSPDSAGEFYTPLDLRNKRYTFTPTDNKICGKVLVRENESLNYSCTLELPRRSSTSHLKAQLTERLLKVKFGKSTKEVEVHVSDDAKYVTFSTQFDASSVDFELAEFNDEFFKVYDRSAQLVIAEAMRKSPLRIQVLEN